MIQRKRKHEAWDMVGAIGWPEKVGEPVGTPIAGGFSLMITSFNQVLGPELLTNGDFSSGLTGWTIFNPAPADPECTEVAPGNLHGGGGAGALNLFSSATNNQPRAGQSVTVVGRYYYSIFSITARSQGAFAFVNSANSQNNYALTTVGQRQMYRATSTAMNIQGAGAAPINLTVDNFSMKELTLNTRVDAIPTAVFEFGLPSAASFTSAGGMEVHGLYRIADGANKEFVDCLSVYIRRNQADNSWDLRGDTFVNAVRGNQRNVASVGWPDAIGVIVDSSDNHQLYTVSGGVATLRGASFNSTVSNTGKGVNVIYAPEIVPRYISVAA